MRKPRRVSLCASGIFHKMWRGHNREHVLESHQEKTAYLGHLAKTYTDKIEKRVQWHSYCLMGNHSHEQGRLLYNNQSEAKECIGILGNWMRNAHSRFGAEYNRRHKRQGKVAYDRPKTQEIDRGMAVLKVMFYGDANPMRAGMVSHPSRYPYSSHRFYAYGEKSRFTMYLTPPAEYLALGKTAEGRRRKYRQLCDVYLREKGLIDDAPSEEIDVLEFKQEVRLIQLENPDTARSRGDPSSS